MAKGRLNGDKYIVYIISNSSTSYLEGSASLLSTLVTTPVGDGADSLGRFELYRKGNDGKRNLITSIGLADETTSTA